MAKVTVPRELLFRAFPEARVLQYLPRKRKKKLKRRISKKIIEMLQENSEQIMDEQAESENQ